MKRILFLLFFSVPLLSFAQTNFDPVQYYQFLAGNQNLSADDLLARYQPASPYFSASIDPLSCGDIAYLDSIKIKFGLTKAEYEKLEKNHFVITERLNYDSFGRAFHEIYKKDLPVFISTDAVLHALHRSYDAILMDMEVAVLRPKLQQILSALYENYPALVAKYQANTELHSALADLDLYITMAKSLFDEKELRSQFNQQEQIDTVWQAVQAEQAVDMPLFSVKKRHLDFSQFKVRGHYTRQIWDGQEMVSLANYFRAMMWLGRIDFFLSPPPVNPWEEPWTKEDVRRMHIGVFLCNELMVSADVFPQLKEMDSIIRFLVGESDNLTPFEYQEIVATRNIKNAAELLDDAVYDSLYAAIISPPVNGQKILSSIFLMDPFSEEPGQLPVSYRLMGQRFIVDSYIFSNVVFDRIIYNGKKIWRPLPDPLDAMFVLGNRDALPLLQDTLKTYHYSSQLNALHYLVNEYDASFWDSSLYNSWLQAIRLLNPAGQATNLPFFMQTTAWHQEKLNTQLASWAQLRHDNLLYAKQSYTGGTGCSFPHSFVEPYPEFYAQIGKFARKAEAFFSGYPTSPDPFSPLRRIHTYFPKLRAVMDTLTILAEKELQHEPFNDEEKEYLQKMLFVTLGSGAPPFSGWYADLFYYIDDAALPDYTIADVHTQPTDREGNTVGRILHVAVGRVNIGVFISQCPSDGYAPMAFAGPVMSYYEKVTKNYERLTDEDWAGMVISGQTPQRPDWVNLFLTDSAGKAGIAGRELPGVLFSAVDETGEQMPDRLQLYQNYPNPFNPVTHIRFFVAKTGNVNLSVYNLLGQKVATLFNGNKMPGFYHVNWFGKDETGRSLPSGIYIYRLKTEEQVITRKLTLLQ